MIKNKKHIRLRGYDYSSEGWYFVTICTHNHECFFGEIHEKIIHLTKTGEQAKHYWEEIPLHFSKVELGQFIVMPNHIHGIIAVKNKNNEIPDVGARHDVPLHQDEMNLNTFGKTMPNSLSVIIGRFKSALTLWCNQNNFYFKWQSRFYDHIIRNQKEFDNISNYIDFNVERWEEDKFCTLNLFLNKTIKPISIK